MNSMWTLVVICISFCTIHLGASQLITQHPENFNVKLGDSLNISCESEWTFDQWLLNDVPISDGDDYAITSTSTGSRLLIKSFEGDEAGEYRCRFSNGSKIVLSQPGRVKYFYDAGFDLEPQNFDSYLLNDGSREVISFECRATQTSTNVRPIITWQWCEDIPDTYTDIIPSTMTIVSGRRSGLLTHYFLQNGYTGYLQILDPENPNHNGADVRCKVSSSIPGDNCTYYSPCAEITTYFAQHSPPPDFPIFRTIPPADIFLTDSDVGVMACTVGVMACTVQYQNTSNAREVIFENEEGILTFNFFWAGNDSIGIDFVPNSNLMLDTSRIVTPYTDSTYTCRLHGEMEAYTTTFHIISEPMSDSNGDKVNVLLQENAQYEFTFQLSDTSSGFMDHRVFFNGANLASPNVEVVVADQRQLTLNFTSAQEIHKGAYQVELENKAGIVSVYLCVDVNVTIPPSSSAAPQPSATPSSSSAAPQPSATPSPSDTPSPQPATTSPPGGTSAGGGSRLPVPNTTILILAIVIPIFVVLAVILLIVIIILLCICCNKDDEEEEEESKGKEAMEMS